MAFDFDRAVSAPFRMQPGLQRLPAGTTQLTPNRLEAPHLAAKLDVLGSRPHSALLQRPGFDPTPALHAVASHAAAEHPAAWSVDASHGWCAHWLGWRVGASGEVGPCGVASPPDIGDCLRAIAADWRQPALLALAFQEDFAIVDGSDATLPWLAVALPSHWAPQTKVGRHFAEVHAPVADNRLLLTAGEHLMRLVTQADRWQRFVWQITPHRELHHHPAHSPARHWPSDANAEAVAAQAWFRTERQTFIPVPAVRQAVFTIQVGNLPLAEAVTDPAHAALLHAALVSMSPAVLAYRDLAAVREPLLAWLAARMAVPGAV
ncbi:MAG: DUF3445 domain-containing protein [Vitreoscilla sp.]|nr:DUF3445 domain-containing protein [Vitreoscilla sp.]